MHVSLKGDFKGVGALPFRALAMVGWLGLAISGCESGENINKIWGGDDHGADGMLQEAKVAYDHADYTTSQNIATKLLDRNPDNEAAAIILGFSYLSEGGIDPFKLARSLVSMDTSATSMALNATAVELPGLGQVPLADEDFELAAASNSSSSSSDTSASSTLTTLAKKLLSLSDADLANLSSGQFGAAQNGNKEPKLFVGSNALLLPRSVDETLRASVPVLDAMNKAIKAVCRFVDDSVKNKEDDRDVSASCAGTSVARQSQNKSHFLWAFSHLTEALVYQTVVLFTSSGATQPSINSVSTAVQGIQVKSATELTTFIDEVKEVNYAIGLVFNTTDSNSMLKAALMDLTATSNAFAAMSGMPASVTSQITQAFSSIQTLGKTLSGNAATNVASNTKAFKSQMTANLGTNIGTKIDVAADEAAKELSGGSTTSYSKLSAADQTKVQTQLKDMCSTYTDLTQGQKVTKPSACGT